MKNRVRVAAAIAAIAMLSGCSVFKTTKKTPVLGQRVPILASENDIVPDKPLSGVEVIVPEAEANDAWSQPGGSPSKSMGHLALGDSIGRAWTVSISGATKRARLAAAPVVEDNRLFLVDTDGAVNAFAADTGAKLWRAETVEDKANKLSRFGGGVSVDFGTVYATNGLGDVVALSAADGTVVWRAHPGGPLRGAPTIANGNVYVLSQDNQLFALTQDSGKVFWTASASPESQGVFGVAAPAAGLGTVVVGFSSGELNAYRYENGTMLWADVLSRSSVSTSVSSISDIDASPVIDNGRAYAVGQGGRMVAIDMGTGTRVWEQNIAGISTPWVAGEWLFVVTDDARLLCIARGSGKVRWIAQLQHYKNPKKLKGPINWVGPVLAGGRLILANTEGEVVSVSVKDGSVQSAFKGTGTYSLSPVVANNTLYLLDDKGKLTAYR